MIGAVLIARNNFPIELDHLLLPAESLVVRVPFVLESGALTVFGKRVAEELSENIGGEFLAFLGTR